MYFRYSNNGSKSIYSRILFYDSSQPLPKRFLHRVWPSASSNKLQYLHFSLISSNSCLHLLPHLPVRSIFPSIKCFRRQFLCKIWPIQLFFLCFIACGNFFPSSTLCNISLFTRSVQVILSIPVLHILKLSRYFWSTVRSVQVSAPYQAMPQMQHGASFFRKFKFNLLVKRVSFLICI